MRPPAQPEAFTLSRTTCSFFARMRAASACGPDDLPRVRVRARGDSPILSSSGCSNAAPINCHKNRMLSLACTAGGICCRCNGCARCARDASRLVNRVDGLIAWAGGPSPGECRGNSTKGSKDARSNTDPRGCALRIRDFNRSAFLLLGWRWAEIPSRGRSASAGNRVGDTDRRQRGRRHRRAGLG